MNDIKDGFNQVRLKVRRLQQNDVQEGHRLQDHMTAIKRLKQNLKCAISVISRFGNGRNDAIK